MDHSFHGRPPTRRRALADATLRANVDHRLRSPRSVGDKLNSNALPTPAPNPNPHNESLVANGTLAVRKEAQPSPQHHRLSAVIDESRPRNTKRDSEISNASTNASTGGRRKTHIGPWQLGRTIGKGGCSRVRVVRHATTGQFGAAKIISKATAERVRALSLANLVESAQHDPTLIATGKAIPFGLEREICIMKLLNHPYIVRLYDIWENRNELYLIMEYVEGGELFSYIGECGGGLDEMEAVHIFRQIIAALWYCHRLKIFHRDLKPENILLDRNTMTIKLVDFGMAALQPKGQKLTTPCGSPHYAAPEVIGSKAYDGGKADVWSCGVILYVLLTGTPPFNYDGYEGGGDHENLKPLFNAITLADYVMPDYISSEAQDLIRAILVPDPKRRISIDKIWNHPFMRKFDDELDFRRTEEHFNLWLRPHPPVEWVPLTRATIDREILRYMRTLWHSEKEETLIQRLLSKDVEKNHEKFFYAALARYQNEMLENYAPSPHHSVGYSHSDYHHQARRSPTSKDMLQLPAKNHRRTKSGYSILNDEHLYSKHSFYEQPPSDVSYDPFRASREPVLPNQDLHQNITVHRESSSGSRQRRPTTALGHRTGSSLRIQALTNSKRGSVATRVSSKRSTSSQRSAYVRRSSVSRSSLGSYLPSSPPVFVRPSSSSRRGVSFSHLRRTSAATASTAETAGMQCTPVQRKKANHRRGSAGSSSRSSRPSTVSDSPSVRPLPRIAALPAVPRLRVRKPDSPSKYIQSEARKVSTELEKVMEEAFNRSSIGSSVRTSTTSDPRKEVSGYGTPLTAFSNRDSGATGSNTPDHQGIYQNRPLPPVPTDTETPNTFLQRKLAETRAEIARRLEESGESTEHFNEVLDHLDRLMVPAVNSTKRTCSAPAKSPEQPAPLHVIPEEAKTDGEDLFEPYRSNYRAVTDPVRPSGHGRPMLTDDTTIRIVDQSPAHIAPLTIRKKSETSRSTKSENVALTLPWPGPVRHISAPPRSQAESGAFTGRTNQPPAPNAASDNAEKKEATIKKKKSSWFRRTPEDRDRSQENQPKPVPGRLQIPEAWQGLDGRIKNDPPKASTPNPDLSKHAAKYSGGSTASEFPMRHCGTTVSKSEGGGTFKGFLGLFGKKSKEDKFKRQLELGDNFSTSSLLSNFDSEINGEAQIRPSPPDFQMNWLSRFLHIKPASRALCFHVRRGKVRQELVHLLRDWQRYGIRDIVCDRENNIINARVDKNNRLNLKPVAFVIELFVVLEYNKRANLCLARFTQTRGAASSFRRAVEVIEDVCRQKHILIEDEQKKAGMCEILG